MVRTRGPVGQAFGIPRHPQGLRNRLEPACKGRGGRKGSTDCRGRGQSLGKLFMDPMVSFIQTVWNRDKNRKTVVVFRHTQGGYWKWPLKDRRLHHSRQSLDWDRLLKQAMVFASPEYNNPFMQQKETETFLRSLWKVVSGGRPGKAGKSWTDAWEKIKEAFLNAGTAPQEDAGSQVLPEQGAGQG